MTTVPAERALRNVRRCIEGPSSMLDPTRERGGWLRGHVPLPFRRSPFVFWVVFWVPWGGSMGSGAGDVLAQLDVSALGKAMLDAAGAARIGVTVTFVDEDPPRNAYVSDVAAEILGWPVETLLG